MACNQSLEIQKDDDMASICWMTKQKVLSSSMAAASLSFGSLGIGCKPPIRPGGGGVLPYMGYIGMCGTKGYGFSAVLFLNRVSLLAILPPFW